MTVRTKVALGIALILAFVLTGMGITAMTVHRQRAALNEVEKAAETVSATPLFVIVRHGPRSSDLITENRLFL